MSLSYSTPLIILVLGFVYCGGVFSRYNLRCSVCCSCLYVGLTDCKSMFRVAGGVVARKYLALVSRLCPVFLPSVKSSYCYQEHSRGATRLSPLIPRLKCDNYASC